MLTARSHRPSTSPPVAASLADRQAGQVTALAVILDLGSLAWRLQNNAAGINS